MGLFMFLTIKNKPTPLSQSVCQSLCWVLDEFSLLWSPSHREEALLSLLTDGERGPGGAGCWLQVASQDLPPHPARPI